jgi:hypothetical protein
MDPSLPNTNRRGTLSSGVKTCSKEWEVSPAAWATKRTRIETVAKPKPRSVTARGSQSGVLPTTTPSTTTCAPFGAESTHTPAASAPAAAGCASLPPVGSRRDPDWHPDVHTIAPAMIIANTPRKRMDHDPRTSDAPSNPKQPAESLPTVPTKETATHLLGATDTWPSQNKRTPSERAKHRRLALL